MVVSEISDQVGSTRMPVMHGLLLYRLFSETSDFGSQMLLADFGRVQTSPKLGQLASHPLAALPARTQLLAVASDLLAGGGQIGPQLGQQRPVRGVDLRVRLGRDLPDLSGTEATVHVIGGAACMERLEQS